jgi:uroporphyrinogen-III synthase
VETLKISAVEVSAVPAADVWVVSSRNSFYALKKFHRVAPQSVYCVGVWMKNELAKSSISSTVLDFPNMKELADDLVSRQYKTILYFCGREHRTELEDAVQGSSTSIQKVITHDSLMTFPKISRRFDAVFVFSPRAAESLLKFNTFESTTCFACIGPTTARYLQEQGFQNIFTPSYPDSRILLEELHEQMLKRRI